MSDSEQNQSSKSRSDEMSEDIEERYGCGDSASGTYNGEEFGWGGKHGGSLDDTTLANSLGTANSTQGGTSGESTYFTSAAVSGVLDGLKNDPIVEDAQTSITDDSWVIVAWLDDKIDIEDVAIRVPKLVHLDPDDYTGSPELYVRFGSHEYSGDLLIKDTNVLAEAEPVDSVELMYGDAFPEDVDEEELRRLLDEKDLTFKEAIERLDVDGSDDDGEEFDTLHQKSHKCSYCGTAKELDTEQRVVADCSECQKRRYFNPVGDSDGN